MIVSPTLACGDILSLSSTLTTLQDAGISRLHLDMMDAHYVPNLCFSFDVIEAIAKDFPDFEMDIHLMTDRPEFFIERLSKLKPYAISIHPQTVTDIKSTFSSLKESGIKVGIVLSPQESLEKSSSLLKYCDQLTIMGVTPGFSGQSFLEDTYEKIRESVKIRNNGNLSFDLEVDGGVDAEIAVRCKQLGVDIVVAGAMAIFHTGDLLSATKKIMAICA